MKKQNAIINDERSLRRTKKEDNESNNNNDSTSNYCKKADNNLCFGNKAVV